MLADNIIRATETGAWGMVEGRAALRQAVAMTAFIEVVAGGDTFERWPHFYWPSDAGLLVIWVVVGAMSVLLAIAAFRAFRVYSKSGRRGYR